MYIRTREGSAQGSLPYSFGDVTASLSEPELGEPKRCKPRYFVTRFLPGSSRLRPLHARILRDIAKYIVGFAQREKDKAGIKGKADIDLVLHVEGHVDKRTDPKNFGTLDMDRAKNVVGPLSDHIKLPPAASFGILMNFEYSAAGSQPISTNSRTNRGVVICVRSIKVKQASP